MKNNTVTCYSIFIIKHKFIQLYQCIEDLKQNGISNDYQHQQNNIDENKNELHSTPILSSPPPPIVNVNINNIEDFEQMLVDEGTEKLHPDF